MSRLWKAWFVVLAVAILGLQALGKVWTDPADWEGHKRTLIIQVKDPAMWDIVYEAVQIWNNANSGNNNWVLVADTQPPADVVVDSVGSLPGGDVGYTKMNQETDSLTGEKYTSSADVDIVTSGRTHDQVLSVVLHELGHAIGRNQARCPCGPVS